MIYPSAVIVAAQVLAATAPGADAVEAMMAPPTVEVVVNRGGAAEPVEFAVTDAAPDLVLAAAVIEGEAEAAVAEDAIPPAADDRGVTVHRGPGIVRTAPPSGSRPAPFAHRLPAVRTAGGRGLWMLDAEQQRVVACRLFKTTQVYGYRIRCFERKLRQLR